MHQLENTSSANRGKKSAGVPPSPLLLQRKRSGSTGPVGDDTKEIGQGKPQRQMATVPSPDQRSAVPAVVNDVLRSPGRSLEPGTRSFMESRFDRDFSNVRVHTGSLADTSARAVSANAYTVGEQIVFGAGRYSPETTEGRKLIAHELTHTVQQRGASSPSTGALGIDDPGSSLEKQAEHAEGIAAGPEPGGTRTGFFSAPSSAARPSVQRQPAATPMDDPKRYQQVHDVLFKPPGKTPAASGGGAPTFDAAAKAKVKQQFTQWITDLRKTEPLKFAHYIDPNTNKDDADASAVDMDKQIRARFPQIARPMKPSEFLPHITVLTEAQMADDDYLHQWLANHMVVTNLADFQLGEKDPAVQTLFDDLLADATVGPLVRELARHQGAFVEESGNTRDVRLNKGLNASQRELSLVHELVHFYAAPEYKKWVDSTVNPRVFGEGLTEFLARKAMTPDQLKANGKMYQDRVDVIEKEIASRIPEDDIARAYFAGEVWRIEGKSGAAQQTFKEQTGLDPAAKRADEKKQSNEVAGIIETVAPGERYRFMNLGDELPDPKPEHIAFFGEIFKQFVANDSTARVRFVGHASSPGTPAFNDALSRQRSLAFYEMARATGVPENQFVDAALLPLFGKTQPTAGNEDVQGRAFNRRVELFITHAANANGSPATPSPADAESGKKSGEVLQRKASGPMPDRAPAIVHEVLHSSGEALDATARAKMEPGFGHDFSRVRIHADQRAGASAQAVGAEAYTVGNHVVFAPGQFQLHTESGRRLLAHELTHVVQQGGRDFSGGSLGVGRSDDPREFEAEKTATSFSNHRTANPAASRTNVSGATTLQRQSTSPNGKFDLASSEIGQRISAGLNKVMAQSTERDAPPQPQVDPSLVLGLLASSNRFLHDAATAQKLVPGLQFDFFSEDSTRPNEFSRRDSLISAEVTTLPRTVWRIVHEVVHASHGSGNATGTGNKGGAVTQAAEAGVREESNTRARENEIMEEIKASSDWPRNSDVEPTPATTEDVRNSFRSGSPKLTYQELFIIEEMKEKNRVEGVSESEMRAIARTLLTYEKVSATSAAQFMLDPGTLKNKRATAHLTPPPTVPAFSEARACLRQHHVRAYDRGVFPSEKETSPACLDLLHAAVSQPPPMSDESLQQLLMGLNTKNEIKRQGIQDSSALISFLDRVPEKDQARATRLLEWVTIAEAMSYDWKGHDTPNADIRNQHLDFLQARIGKGLAGVSRPPASSSVRKTKTP